MKTVCMRLGKPTLALSLCTVAAVVMSLLSAERAWRVFVPLAFVAVIMLITARFELWVSMLASVIASLIFAYFLFPPLRSFRIEDKVERGAVAWMILAGIVLPFLFAPLHTARRR